VVEGGGVPEKEGVLDFEGLALLQVTRSGEASVPPGQGRQTLPAMGA
jgi:hypothetical protein